MPSPAELDHPRVATLSVGVVGARGYTGAELLRLIAGLEDAWEFFGGVTARVVLDNLRAAICKADRYDPIFSRVFEEYSRHRGFVIDPANAPSKDTVTLFGLRLRTLY